MALPFQQFYFLFQQILVLERESVPSVDTLCSDEWYLLWQWMVLCSQTRSLYDIKEKKKELPSAMMQWCQGTATSARPSGDSRWEACMSCTVVN